MTEEKNINDEELKNEEEIAEGAETELEAVKKKAEEYLEGWKRAKADYMNLKKESEKKYQDLIQFANAGLIFEFLPVLDNFKLAVNHIPEAEKNADWVIGITHIKKQFEDIFKNLGIEEIKTVGEKFNPALHEAVGREDKFEEGKEGEEGIDGQEEEKEDIIVKEVRAGYMLNGKVIQAAKVIVS